MQNIQSFLPIGDSKSKVLILGSMPGKQSLAKNQYYAHPQNAFWKIMGELLDIKPNSTYENRLDLLCSAGIALWDVLASCERSSSLDSHIKNEQANDFTSFFIRHPNITQVFFNGSKAEQCFKKFVQNKQTLPPLQYCRLPSTSPAHAGMCYEDKLQAWGKVEESPTGNI
jgi:hypoxanthine-DNA glycosylase